MELSVVVPCYNEEAVLAETASRMCSLIETMKQDGLIEKANIYFVDDGSKDKTWELIESHANQFDCVKGIKLSRNKGHQNALLAGLFTVKGDIIVSIDADLQDDIHVIPEMIKNHKEGSDVVYGVRKKRNVDTYFKRKTAESFYTFMKILGVDVVHNHADYRLLSRRAIEDLKSFRETNLFLRGIVPLIGYKSSIVYYDREERFAGESKYPLKKMLAFAWDGITSFSVVPLRFISFIGFMVFLGTVIMSAWILGIKLFTSAAVPGWASTVLPVYLLGGVQILCIGVIGEYLGKIYSEVKARPRYIIEKVRE